MPESRLLHPDLHQLFGLNIGHFGPVHDILPDIAAYLSGVYTQWDGPLEERVVQFVETLADTAERLLDEALESAKRQDKTRI